MLDPQSHSRQSSIPAHPPIGLKGTACEPACNKPRLAFLLTLRSRILMLLSPEEELEHSGICLSGLHMQNYRKTRMRNSRVSLVLGLQCAYVLRLCMSDVRWPGWRCCA